MNDPIRATQVQQALSTLSAGWDAPDRSLPHMTTHTRGEKLTSKTWGRGGDIMVRIYDKVEELNVRVSEPSALAARLETSDKAAREVEAWQAAGWQVGEPVTRVEVQVRGDALKELCDRAQEKVEAWTDEEDYLRKVDAMVERMAARVEEAIDGIWKYVTCKWLYKVVPDGDTRPSRCEIDPWWKEVQDVSFLRIGAEPLTRVRIRTGVKSAQATGAVLSLLAKRQEASPWWDPRGGTQPPDERAIAQFAYTEHPNASVEQIEARAVGRLRRAMRRAYLRAADFATEDAVRMRGPGGALERFIAKSIKSTADLWDPDRAAA